MPPTSLQPRACFRGPLGGGRGSQTAWVKRSALRGAADLHGDTQSTRRRQALGGVGAPRLILTHIAICGSSTSQSFHPQLSTPHSSLTLPVRGAPLRQSPTPASETACEFLSPSPSGFLAAQQLSLAGQSMGKGGGRPHNTGLPGALFCTCDPPTPSSTPPTAARTDLSGILTRR